jgi:hypothetical protein
MTDKAAPTVKSIAAGLAKLYREVGNLRSEVAKLNDWLGEFKTRHPMPAYGPPDELSSLWSTRVRPQTEEPTSAIRAAVYEFKDTDDLAIPTKTLLAIGKDLEGALRDIRAARSDIQLIVDDADLRSEFKNWQNNQ